MHELLTERLAVLGQARLKQTFSAALAFAVKGAAHIPKERMNFLLKGVKEFAHTPAMYFRLRELSLHPENINIFLQALADGVYAASLAKTLQKQMLPVLAEQDCTLQDCMNVYTAVYAHQLLYLGARTILNPENGFNPETVRFFIENPEKTHGEELINDIPPLLENGYIYLNNCGFEQRTDWHRNTFTDSWFKALMSYMTADILDSKEIRKAFQLSEKPTQTL